jgi:uncharacterized glyoxalase superfamily protein PhnB
MTAVLTYVSLIAHEVERVADFYRDLFGLEEIAASRSEKYREFLTGGAKLGVVHFGGYAMLGLPVREPSAAVNQILTFDVGRRDRVQPTVEEAVRRGAELVKPAFDTFFGQHQAVLKDPEGNAFRISAASAAA